MTTQNYNRVQIVYNAEHKPYLYGAIHIIDGDLNSQRWEKPFVVSKRRPNGEEVVYGTVMRMLEKVKSPLDRHKRFQLESQEMLRIAGIAPLSLTDPILPESPMTERIIDEQDELLEEVVLTISVNIRILSEIFHKKLKKCKVTVYGYDDGREGTIDLNGIADLLSHNRYILVKNGYVVDLISDEKFMAKKPQMGLKFSLLEYFSEVEKAVNSITVKDLVGVLWALTEKLSASSNVKDIIFLTQNLYTLGGFTVGSDIPIDAGPLKKILDRVTLDYMQRAYPQNSVPEGASVSVSATFNTPRFYLEPELDRKQIRVEMQVNGKPESLVMGCKDFFSEMSRAYGNRKLYANPPT